jgi:uncharacterized paraquat-inducible protein A
MPSPRRARLWLLALLDLAGHALLAAGLLGPALTITPRMGELTSVAAALGILEREETLSIVGSIQRLFEADEVVIGAIIALASIVTPLAKLVVVNRALFDAARAAPVTPWLGRTSRLTKYSLVDVMVVAMLIVSAKAFPGGGTVSARWGLAAFGVAAVLPWIIARGLRAPA